MVDPIQTRLSRFSERMRVISLILFFCIPSFLLADVNINIPNYKYLESHYPEIDESPSLQFFVPGTENISAVKYLFSEPEIHISGMQGNRFYHKYRLHYGNRLTFNRIGKYRGVPISSVIVKPTVLEKDTFVLYRKLSLKDIDYTLRNANSGGYLSSFFPYLSNVKVVKDTSYSWEKPNDLPIEGDSKVDYVIVTDSSFIPYFNEYEDFWWLMGLRTRAVSIQSIVSHYDGISLQNKIRRFLQDAVKFWDVRYVMLAGDNNTIPIIYFHTNFYGRWMDSPTDMYYSCLDGNWNADFDNFLGEAPSDSVDLIPDVALGRLSINTYSDISEYFQKLKTYMLNPDTSILKKALFLGSDLFSSGDGKIWCDTISQYHFPADYYKVVLSEIDGTSAPGNSNQAVIDSLNKGFYFYYHNSHGSHNQIQLKHASPRVYITNEDCDNFNNQYPNIVFVVSCYTNEFPFDVLGEHWVLQSHGAISYIASINDEFPYPAMYFEKPFFDSLFNSSYNRIGDILNIGKFPIMSYAQTDGVYRDIYLFESLEGDPAVPVWKGIPHRLTILSLPDTITQGDTFSVQVLANTKEKIDCNMITPDRQYEHVNIMTDHVSHLHPIINKSGNLIVSFYHKDYVPVIDTIFVKPSLSTPEITNIRIDDSLNKYPDGIIENGDTVTIIADMVHHDSTPYTVYLSSDQDITVLKGIYSDSTVYPGDTSNMTFEIHIPYTVKNRSVPIILNIPHVYTDTFNLQVKSPNIVHKTHEITRINPGEYSINVNLLNRGNGNGFDYSYTLTAEDTTYTVFSVSDTLPHIFRPESTFNIGPVNFNLPLNYRGNINDIKLLLTIRGMNDSTLTEFYCDTIQKPQFLTSTPYAHSIDLIWNNIPEAVGYDLFIKKDGNFLKINRDLIKDGTFYTVNNLKTDSLYAFKVRAYDKYMNHSEFSDVYLEKTNPSFYDGWPLNNNDISLSSIIPADFFGDGNTEIFEAFKSGKLLMTYLNGDTVPGWPVQIESEIWGTPAVADVDGDGKLEIAVAPWSSSDKVYLFKPDGTLVNGWPRDVQGDPGNKGLYGVAGSPVIRDINGDSIDEIIVGATNGDIFVWEPDGSGYYRSDGLFAKRAGDNWDLNVVSPQDLDNENNFILYAISREGILYAFSSNQFDSDSLAIPVLGTPDTLLGGTYYQPTAGDVGPMNGKELVFVAGNNLYLTNDSLELYPNFPIAIKPNVFVSQPILIDVDNNGYKDIILSVGDSMYCYNYQGIQLDNYPYEFGTAEQSSPVAGILNDTTFIFMGTGDLSIRAYAINGSKMAGFPIETEDNFYCSPSLGDSLLGAVDYTSNTYIWRLPVIASPWPSIYHDLQNTGDADFPLNNNMGMLTKKISTTNIGRSVIRLSLSGNVLHIKGLSADKKYSIKIYDISGREIRFNRINRDKIDLLKRQNGVYFIKINSADIKYSGKFILIK